jgi:hypothetical protein
MRETTAQTHFATSFAGLVVTVPPDVEQHSVNRLEFD